MFIVLFLLCQVEQKVALTTEEIAQFKLGHHFGMTINYHVKRPIDGFNAYLVPNTFLSTQTKTRDNFIGKFPVSAKSGSLVVELSTHMKRRGVTCQYWTIYLEPYLEESIKIGDITLYSGRDSYQPSRVIEPFMSGHDCWSAMFDLIALTD